MLLHSQSILHVRTLPFTECDNSQDVWRKYCGSVLPGDFVSRCKSKCVQMRLFSDMKFLSGPAFLGLNVTVEPTNESRYLAL
jgi:hypothetical protein